MHFHILLSWRSALKLFSNTAYAVAICVFCSYLSLQFRTSLDDTSLLADHCLSLQELLYDKQKLLDNGAPLFAVAFTALSAPSCGTCSAQCPSTLGTFVHASTASAFTCNAPPAGDRWETEIAANLKAESLYR